MTEYYEVEKFIPSVTFLHGDHTDPLFWKRDISKFGEWMRNVFIFDPVWG